MIKYSRIVNVEIEVTDDGNCGFSCQMAACDGREEGLCALFGQNIDREGRHQDCIKLCEGQEPKHTCAEFLKLINIKSPDFEKVHESHSQFTFSEWKQEFMGWLAVNHTIPTEPKKFPPGIGVRYGVPLKNK